MFFAGSRYAAAGSYVFTDAAGRKLALTRIPLPAPAPLRGFLRRVQERRLDLVAYEFLHDPTAFWKLCDSNNAVSPAALLARDRVGVPNS